MIEGRTVSGHRAGVARNADLRGTLRFEDFASQLNGAPGATRKKCERLAAFVEGLGKKRLSAIRA